MQLLEQHFIAPWIAISYEKSGQKKSYLANFVFEYYSRPKRLELQDPESRKLRSQLAVVRNQIHSLEEQVRDYIGYHVEHECRALCDFVQEKLPRELRDHIYELMLPRGSYTIIDASFLSNDNWAGKIMNGRNEHICKIQFVGPASLKETLETWYRIATFRFEIENLENRDIRAFFAHDRCGFGLNIRELVRNVTLFAMSQLPDKQSMDNLIASMKELLVMRSRSNITLSIGLHVYYDAKKLREDWIKFVNSLAALFPAIQQLLQAGHQVKMDIDYGSYVFQVQEDELNLEDWLEKLKLPSYRERLVFGF